MTYKELKERLMEMDEVDLMELLQLTSEDIVNKFGDEIDDKIEELFFKFEEDDQSEEE